jgi:hypothetical protein
MKAVSGGGGGGGGRRRTSVLTAVDCERAASSPIVVGGGEAIVGVQWTMAGGRMLVGGRFFNQISQSNLLFTRRVLTQVIVHHKQPLHHPKNRHTPFRNIIKRLTAIFQRDLPLR